MSKPEKFNLNELERSIKRQMLDLWHAAQEKKYNPKKWDEFQSDFDYYCTNVKKMLRVETKP